MNKDPQEKYSIPFKEIGTDKYLEDECEGSFLTGRLLAKFRKSPRLYHHIMNIATKDFDAIFGETTGRGRLAKAERTLIFEGRAEFDRQYLISDGPINRTTGGWHPTTSPEWREWRAQQDREVISSVEFDLLTRMQQAVWCHPIASKMIDEGEPNKVIAATIDGEPCQSLFDWWREDYEGKWLAARLMVCLDVDYTSSDLLTQHIPFITGFDADVFSHATSTFTPPQFIVICVETKAPWRCKVCQIDHGRLQFERTSCEFQIDRLRECRRTNNWPTLTEELEIID